MSGSMSEVWRRSQGRTSEAPPNERGGNRYVRPTATASHLDSTISTSPSVLARWLNRADSGRSRNADRTPKFDPQEFSAAARLEPEVKNHKYDQRNNNHQPYLEVAHRIFGINTEPYKLFARCDGFMSASGSASVCSDSRPASFEASLREAPRDEDFAQFHQQYPHAEERPEAGMAPWGLPFQVVSRDTAVPGGAPANGRGR